MRKFMSVQFSAEAGFGLRVAIDSNLLLDSKFDVVKDYIWDSVSENSRAFYGNILYLLDDGGDLDMDVVGEAFKHLSFQWHGNPFVPEPGYWFAVVKSTFVKLDDISYVDLSDISKVSAEALEELEIFQVLSDSVSPRWYMWSNVG